VSYIRENNESWDLLTVQVLDVVPGLLREDQDEPCEMEYGAEECVFDDCLSDGKGAAASE
jgi:hypothetical protein